LPSATGFQGELRNLLLLDRRDRQIVLATDLAEFRELERVSSLSDTGVDCRSSVGPRRVHQKYLAQVLAISSVEVAQADLKTVVSRQGLANCQNCGAASTTSGEQIPYEFTSCLMMSHKSSLIPGHAMPA
jgi:hypothetical protein